MKLKTTLTGIGLAILIAGCGGGGSNDFTPTGTLNKDISLKSLELISSTGLYPAEIIEPQDEDERIYRRNKIYKNKKVYAQNETYNCFTSGTVEIKQEGKAFYDSNKTNGTYKLIFKYNNCQHFGYFTNGAEIYTENWAKNGDKVTVKYTKKSDGDFKIKYDKSHYAIYSYTKTGTEVLQKVIENENNETFEYYETISYNDQRTINGKAIAEDKTIEFKNLTRTKSGEHKNNTSGISWNEKWALNGFFSTPDTKGWIKIETKKAFEKNNNDIVGEDEDEDIIYCNHSGKLILTDKNGNTAINEVKNDHSINFYYNNKLIKKYENCIQFD
jgi:hypothetical protein